MRCNSNIDDETAILVRRYTAYLNLVLNRKRKDYLRAQRLRIEKETEAKQKNDYMSDIAEDDFFEGLPLLQQIENPTLAAGLRELKERDRLILIAHAVEGKSYDELSVELGLPYKSVATIYYRTLQKIKERMEQNDGF